MIVKVEITSKLNDEIILDCAYQHALQGFIYNCLGDTLAKQIHDKEGKRNYKFFVFSRLFSDSFTVDTTAKKIKFKPPCYFYVASANDDFIQSLANGLFLKKDLVIGMNTVITKSISVVNSDVENNEIKVKTLSPIVVRSTENGKSFYYKPVDGEWVRKVKENLARKYFAFCGVKIDENEVDIRVIRHSKEVTTFYKNCVIKGYDAILYIKARKDILKFVLQTGLGEKNSMGFGFVVDLR